MFRDKEWMVLFPCCMPFKCTMCIINFDLHILISALYYFILVDLLPSQRAPYICNASDPKNWHPPSYMFDNDNTTYWQSTASTDEAEIVIDIQATTQQVCLLIVKYC